ncbi:Nicotianamine synthase [Fimicolochytrium jonesii]|uniref:Nicotianamine synthase n=1 Tax=Fimicolochytrium jonesii TaxID=1396493 RepID=UPI0022FE68EA|nr:Nicotianamine synthase [Fimicolochytrium jonesii]KAI8822845.1 Nicotianamine synthase [Fimicolochytrium jonesii]
MLSDDDLEELVAETSANATATVQARNTLVYAVLHVYQQFSEQRSLTPTAEVNALFSELVGLCGKHLPDTIVHGILAHPGICCIIPHLRNMCAEGEYQLEMSWSRRILRQGEAFESRPQLRDFPYFSNYVDLTRMELNAISSVLPRAQPAPNKFVLLGSGPLPMTSICLARETPIQSYNQPHCVHNIDCSMDALICSTQLVADPKLRNDPDFAAFDVVYLAALVGLDVNTKRKVLERLHRAIRPGALLVARSAHSLRTLLYSPIDVGSSECHLKGFKPLLVMHPHNHIINSVLIASCI